MVCAKDQLSPIWSTHHYRPISLREAEAQGCITVDGLGMLLHQAAPGFERWFGQRPEVDSRNTRCGASLMFKLGLTGSIGMGKTTTASIFSALGCDVWDADAAVHRLYAKGGAAVAPMSGAFSQVIEEGAVSRAQLRSLISADPSALKTIEKIVHPAAGSGPCRFCRKLSK